MEELLGFLATGLFIVYAAGGTSLCVMGNTFMDFRCWFLFPPTPLWSRTIPLLSRETCCVSEIAVSRNELCADVEDGLWSILSRLPVVNRTFRRFVGHTTLCVRIFLSLSWLHPSIFAVLDHRKWTHHVDTVCQQDPASLFCCE